MTQIGTKVSAVQVLNPTFKDFAVLEFKSNVNFLISTYKYLNEHIWS